MAAYLVVDVDDLLNRFKDRGISVDLQELAVGLRGGAALAAGLVSADKLKAIAVANWSAPRIPPLKSDPQAIFKAAGYEVFDVSGRENLADVLIIHYFSYDPEPVSELILATTSRDLLPLIRRIKMTRNARIRMWGSEDVLAGTEFADEIIFQPLESLLGIQSKNVSVYIDFENIAISLSEQGFVVNLDHLIERFVAQARAHGHVIKMSAYAPWGQRGTLPPLVDSAGREIADEAPTRLMMANIDPVFNLPGKNSADIRIARDVITDAGHNESSDVYILASGDRDFNEVLNALIQRNKTVIVWGVRGSTSRQLEHNPGVTIEYIEDFTNLQTHQSLSLSTSSIASDTVGSFVPSQWSSVVIQFDRLSARLKMNELTISQMINQLQEVGAVASVARGEDLVSQAISLGILKPVSNTSIILNTVHPIVEKTLLIMNRIRGRVQNTLEMRGWAYVNYGFLLKGLAMERDLDRPGMNENDQWRSHWIDCLVRERILQRELVPHRHNPDDLVPVIRLGEDYTPINSHLAVAPPDEAEPDDWVGLSLEDLMARDANIGKMVMRVIISVEQFTSFRRFAWCPLGSLHKRLRAYDTGMTFQQAVEYLVENGICNLGEYPNPQSNYNTKGISINSDHPIAQFVLSMRDQFVRLLLNLYERNILISEQNLRQEEPDREWDCDFWFSVMETENVLNVLPGRAGQYSLFRTHHTVKLVAGDEPRD